MSAQRNVHLVLKGKKTNVPFFLVVLQNLYAGLKNHPQLFPSTPVDLALFLTQITTLATCQQAMKAKPPGSSVPRDAARDVCSTSAEILRVFVESLCHASPEQSALLAQAAGLQIRAFPPRNKLPLTVKQGPHSGAVRLFANATLLAPGKTERFFNWEYSIDGKTWVAVLSTPEAQTTVTGLPPLTLCGFRVSVTRSKTGLGEWSQIVTFPVH